MEDYTVLALSAESFVEDVLEHFDDIRGRDDEESLLVLAIAASGQRGNDFIQRK